MAKPRVDMPMVEVADVLAILNKIALFGGLTDEQLHTVFGLLKKTRYARGEFIFEEGDEPSDIYIVFGGSVELLLEVDGDYLAEAVFGVGDCFGETAVIGIQRHTAAAMAREDAELIVLPRDGLFSLWGTNTELFAMLVLNIAREACRRLGQADENLLHYFGAKNHRTP